MYTRTAVPFRSTFAMLDKGKEKYIFAVGVSRIDLGSRYQFVSRPLLVIVNRSFWLCVVKCIVLRAVWSSSFFHRSISSREQTLL